MWYDYTIIRQKERLIMRSYYDNDNFFMRWFGKMADVLLLSLLWAVCCLPVVTMGAASIALYDAIARCVHGDQESPFKYFFRVFKTEFLRGLLITLVWAVLAFGLYIGYMYLYQMGKTNSAVGIYSMVYLGTMLIPVGIFAWLIALEARFQYGFFALHKAAATFAIVHLPTTGIALGILAVAVAILVFMPALIVLLPGIVVTFQSWFIEKIFKKYIGEEEQNDSAE